MFGKYSGWGKRKGETCLMNRWVVNDKGDISIIRLWMKDSDQTSSYNNNRITVRGPP